MKIEIVDPQTLKTSKDEYDEISALMRVKDGAVLVLGDGKGVLVTFDGGSHDAFMSIVTEGDIIREKRTKFSEELGTIFADEIVAYNGFIGDRPVPCKATTAIIERFVENCCSTEIDEQCASLKRTLQGDEDSYDFDSRELWEILEAEIRKHTKEHGELFDQDDFATGFIKEVVSVFMDVRF